MRSCTSASFAIQFYDEVLCPQGIGHNAMIALAARDDFRVAFNICRSERQGAFEDNERRIFEVLAPHLRRSVTLGFRLTGYRALRDAAFETIEQLTDGVIIVGQGAQVIYANKMACFLESEGTLKLKPAIATWSAPHSRRLTSLVKSALAGRAGGTMSVASFDRSRLLTIVAAGLRSQEVSVLREAHIRTAACAIFVIDPLRRRLVGTQHLIDAYGLTKAEARVAAAVSSSRPASERGTRGPVQARGRVATVDEHPNRISQVTFPSGSNRSMDSPRAIAASMLTLINARGLKDFLGILGHRTSAYSDPLTRMRIMSRRRRAPRAEPSWSRHQLFLGRISQLHTGALQSCAVARGRAWSVGESARLPLLPATARRASDRQGLGSLSR